MRMRQKLYIYVPMRSSIPSRSLISVVAEWETDLGISGGSSLALLDASTPYYVPQEEHFLIKYDDAPSVRGLYDVELILGIARVSPSGETLASIHTHGLQALQGHILLLPGHLVLHPHHAPLVLVLTDQHNPPGPAPLGLLEHPLHLLSPLQDQVDRPSSRP